MNALVIFVDSLRYIAPLSERLEGLGLERTRYIPPLGYSANILPLLFRGGTADELGFFNEYGPNERDHHRRLALLDGLVELASRVPLLRKVVYRGLRELGVDAANIPLRLLPYFEKCSVSPYALGDRHPSIFDRHDLELVLASGMVERTPQRDLAALGAARAVVAGGGSLYLSLNDLDSVSHEWGLESEEYRAHEDRLFEGIGGLVEQFRDQHGGDAPVVVLSDHGMADVEREVRVDVEEHLGPPGRDRYLYFLDSTLLRVWVYDPRIEVTVEALFDRLGEHGERVGPDERSRWGMADPAAADLMFVLNEGLIFEPNFIGRGVPVAMHGYHPRYESQHAVFLTNRPEVVESDPLKGAGAHRSLDRFLTSG